LPGINYQQLNQDRQLVPSYCFNTKIRISRIKNKLLEVQISGIKTNYTKVRISRIKYQLDELGSPAL